VKPLRAGALANAAGLSYLASSRLASERGSGRPWWSGTDLDRSARVAHEGAECRRSADWGRSCTSTAFRRHPPGDGRTAPRWMSPRPHRWPGRNLRDAQELRRRW